MKGSDLRNGPCFKLPHQHIKLLFLSFYGIGIYYLGCCEWRRSYGRAKFLRSQHGQPDDSQDVHVGFSKSNLCLLVKRHFNLESPYRGRFDQRCVVHFKRGRRTFSSLRSLSTLVKPASEQQFCVYQFWRLVWFLILPDTNIKLTIIMNLQLYL